MILSIRGSWAEPPVAPDRGRITVLRGSTSGQRPRQDNFFVRPLEGKGDTMRRIVSTGILAVIATYLIAAAPGGLKADDDPLPKELKALEGKWNLVALETQGQRAMKFQAAYYVFRPEGKLVWCVEDTPRDDGSYATDPKKSPKTITITYPEGKHLGIYKIEDGKLTICMTKTGAAEKDRPNAFATQGTEYSLFVFERAKEEKK